MVSRCLDSRSSVESCSAATFELGDDMGHVFISYARATESDAERIAAALRAEGHEVWRDDELPPHREYAEVIEERLQDATAVLVLWSSDAVKSQWVRAEADFARQHGTLVQLSLDGAVPPLPFNQIHCDSLKSWTGEATNPVWRKVMASITALGRRGGGPAPGMAPAGVRKEGTERLLAVLPFDNLSGDAEMDYFSDGVSEEILQTVSRLAGLKVIGRASSFQFRGRDKAALNVMGQLGATHSLDGSVRRSGSRVRISASLMECESQTQLWSERYDRDLADVFELQDEIAAAVAKALELVLIPGEARGKVDPGAYDLYLRARSLAGALNEECRGLLEQTVSLAPDFAAGWASLAMARAIDARWRPDALAFAEARDLAEAAAARASALDPSNGLPFVALSLLKAPSAYQEREALLEQALAAAPTDPEILKHASDFTFSVGRAREGFRLIARAHQIDPLNRIIANNYASALSDLGFVRESYDAYEAARARWPDFDWAVVSPLLTAALLRDWDTAAPLAELARGRSGGTYHRALSTLALMQAPPEQARAQMLAIADHQLQRTGAVDLTIITFTFTLGFPDEAFAMVERSDFGHLRHAEGRTPDSLFLLGVIFGVTSAEFRKDARFVDLCARLDLCDYWIATDRWPDCVAEVASVYDFKARARSLVAAQEDVPCPTH